MVFFPFLNISGDKWPKVFLDSLKEASPSFFYCCFRTFGQRGPLVGGLTESVIDSLEGPRRLLHTEGCDSFLLLLFFLLLIIFLNIMT